MSSDPACSLNINCNDDKAATIHRTKALHYIYVCNQCNGGVFTNISDILDHIESHFNDAENSQIVGKDTEELELHPVDNQPVDSIDKCCSRLTHSDFQLCDLKCESQDDQRHLNGHDTINITSIVSDIKANGGNFNEICVKLEVEAECNIEWLQCDICNSTFQTKKKLTFHMRKEHYPKLKNTGKRQMYSCDQCDQHIQGKFLFYAHKYEHLMGVSRFDTDVDDAALMEKLKTFLNDNISYDDSTPEKPFGCKICCHLSVKRRKNIETHILQEHVYRLERRKRSEKLFRCAYCDKTFTHSHNMIVHKRTHTLERPYVCHICNKSFAHSSYMKYHEKVHTGLATHQCALCGIAFKSQTKLNQHNKVHTTETAKCPICIKEFKAHRLSVHIKHVHENEHRPYKCTHTGCSQAFKTAKTLKVHSYRHSGERKYKCRFQCDERFTSTAGRRGHERSKHKTN